MMQEIEKLKNMIIRTEERDRVNYNLTLLNRVLDNQVDLAKALIIIMEKLNKPQ